MKTDLESDDRGRIWQSDIDWYFDFFGMLLCVFFRIRNGADLCQQNPAEEYGGG